MFYVDSDKSIHMTRGDVGVIKVNCLDEATNDPYIFKVGDVVRLSVCAKKSCDKALMIKNVVIYKECTTAEIPLEPSDTKFGEVISKPTAYWYEISLNPDTVPQTIIAYDGDGARTFTLYPEIEETSPTKPEDVPVVDTVLDINSLRPVANQAVCIALERLNATVQILLNAVFPNADATEVDIGVNLRGKRVRFEMTNGVSGIGYEVMFQAGSVFEIFSKDDAYAVTLPNGTTETHSTGSFDTFECLFPNSGDWIVNEYDKNALTAEFV